MNGRKLVIAACGIACLLVVSQARAASAKTECQASPRGAIAARAYVEQQRERVERRNQERAAAKSKVDAANAAASAATGSAAALQANNSDPAAVADAQKKAADTTKDVADALVLWNKADAAASCAQKELDEALTSYNHAKLFSFAVEATASVAGGAGDENREGGALFFSLRDRFFFSEYEFGATFDALTEARVPRHGQTRSFTFGLPLRVFFGNQATSLFLGASPTFVFRSTDPVVGATAQIGMRVLGTAGNTTWVPVSDVKFFAEPRFTFDGTTTAVLFGLEVGLGAGHKSLTDTSLTWALVPVPPSDP